MHEQNIKLPGFLIADLYKNILVDVDIKSTNTIIEPKIKVESTEKLDSIKYLGQNGKRVIVLVKCENDVFLPEEDLTFLSSILKACNLNIADIAIINTAKQALSFAQLKETLNVANILLFNIAPTDVMVPFSIPHFQVHNYDGVSMLVAPALAEINNGTGKGQDLKRELWTSLKKMFGV